MTKRYFKSLRFRIALPFAILNIVLFIFLASYYTSRQKNIFEETRDNEVDRLSAQLIETIETSIEKNELDRIKTAIDIVKSSFDFELLALEIDSFTIKNPESSKVDINAVNADLYIHKEKVFNTDFGRIKIHFITSKNYINDLISKINLPIYFLLGVVLLASLLTTYLFSQKLTSPFQALVTMANNIESTNYNYKINDLPSTNEIQVLYKSLSSLSKTLKERDAYKDQLLDELDVQVRQKTEELSLLSLVAEHTTNSVIITDKNYKIEWVNEAHLNQTGYSFDEVKGKNPKMFQYEKTDVKARRRIRKKLEQLEVVNEEIQNISKQGTEYWLSLNIVPIFKDNEHQGFIAVQTDITNIKNSEEKIKNKNRELEKINHELDNFVYSISHDLRSPLLSLRGIFNMLQAREELSPNSTKLLNMACGSVDRLDGTILEILDYSKNSRQELKPQEFELAKLINNITNDLKHSCPNIRFELNITGNKTVYCDQSRMNIIFKNLIGNSVKYSRPIEDAYVKIDIINFPNELKATITDNGIGIKPEHKEKIFDMFFRGTSKGIGTGLGLYLCKEVVKKMGGKISFESNLNVGTAFTVHFKRKSELFESGSV
jgi:PAS domain S-box-containing protein